MPNTGRSLVPHSKILKDNDFMDIDVRDGKVFNAKKGGYVDVQID